MELSADLPAYRLNGMYSVLLHFPLDLRGEGLDFRSL